MKRLHFIEIDSTNEYAKGLRANGEDVLVTADIQKAGRGTKGRSFSSLEGGVYVTKLKFYDDFPARKAFTIMTEAAVAVCETLEFYGLQPVIKWVNDVYVNDKKICGILIENVFRGDKIASSVVGIGLNVHNDLPQELSNIATTMEQATGTRFSVEEVREKLIECLSRRKDVQEYIRRVGYMGRRVTLISGDERIHATLLSVDEEGGLWVEIGGQRRRFTAAEISLLL
ncbi:MAG: biotin--[Clostridia bacterium]|nr:biotin--[acetyl-CoA-carboxylase] ligase [Clostridia bacterium]